MYRALLSIRVIWISHHHADHICGFPLLLENINRARILYKRYNLSFNLKNNDPKNSENENNGSNDDINNDESDNKSLKSKKILDFNLCKITVIAPPDVIRYYEYTACISGLDELVTFVPVNATLYAGYRISLHGNRYTHLFVSIIFIYMFSYFVYMYIYF